MVSVDRPASSSRATRRAARRRKAPVVYFVLGVLVLLAPVVLTQVKNQEQYEFAEQYSRSVAQIDAGEKQEILRRAHEYNGRLPEVGARDPWVTGPDVTSEAYRDYLTQLNMDSTMARIRVPSVGIDMPVHHGTSQKTLAAGVGHLYGTALPIGGDGSHAVLTGHTGLATMTMFDSVHHIKHGDIMIVEVMGEELAYRVDEITVVLPDEIDGVRPEAGHDRLTLVTCTPYGINTHRLLVRGERTELPSREITQEFHTIWQPWMLAAIVISLAALLYLLWWLRRNRRDNETEPEGGRTR